MPSKLIRLQKKYNQRIKSKRHRKGAGIVIPPSLTQEAYDAYKGEISSLHTTRTKGLGIRSRTLNLINIKKRKSHVKE